MAGKELKFQFAVDEASFAKVKRALAELTAEAQKFAKTLQSTGGFFGGANVGRGGQGQQNQAGGGQRATATTSISSAILKDVEAFKSLAKTGGESMNIMTAAIKKGIRDQESEIGRLDARLQRLAGRYKSLGAEQQQALAKGMLRISGQRNEAASNLSEMQEALSTIPFGNKFRNFINGGDTTPLTMQAARGFIGSLPGGQYVTPLMTGAGGVASGLAGLSVGAAYSYGKSAWNSNLYQGQQITDNAGLMNSYYSKIRANDYTDIRTMRGITQDAGRFSAYQDQVGDPGFFRSMANRASAIWAADNPSEMMNEAMAGKEGTHYKRLMRRKQREFIDNEVADNPFNDVLNEATQNAGSKMSVMRALGIGEGYKKKTGAYRSNARRFLLNFNQFDQGEVIAAVQGIAGAGTRGSAYAGGSALLSTVLQAQAAGINGAAGIGGIMGRQGAGNGSNFVDLMRSMAGAGTDVSTTSLLGQFVAQQADRMNMSGFSGAGLLSSVGFGTQGADGATVARQNIKGMGAIQALYSGSRDPWQKAVNFVAARGVAPGAGLAAQEYLATKMDAARVSEILNTSAEAKIRMTPEEVALGITRDMLGKQAMAIRDTQKYRISPKAFAVGSAAYDMASAMRGGARARDFVNTRWMNDGGRISDSDKELAVGTYASILRQGNKELSFGDAMGQARMELFGQGRRAVKGKMVGDVAHGSVEAKEKAAEAERAKTELDVKDASVKMLEDDIKKSADAYARLRKNTNNLVLTADNVVSILTNLSADLRKATGGPGVPAAANTKTKPK